MTSEWDIIKSIRERVGSGTSADIYGIGDDCAVYKISDGRYGLFSTDISIDGVHFDLRYTSYRDAGYRSMSANVSDIYAMGGRPVLALIALGLPSDTAQREIDDLYTGLLACAEKNSTFIAGGDISRSEKLVISISIYGETKTPVYRKGAKPGDSIYITGHTGLSQLGLELLQKGSDCREYPEAKKRHLAPEPQGELMNAILSHYKPTAMIDISDGLLSDLRHICNESGTGFVIDSELLPYHEELYKFCAGDMNKVLDYSLHSGEEYELLFTSAEHETDIKDITFIGKITDSGFILKNGDSEKYISIKGYDHFK